MVFSAKIELNPDQIKEIISSYLIQNSGIKEINHKDISFNVRIVETGSEMCPVKQAVFQGITIDNVQIGRGKFE